MRNKHPFAASEACLIDSISSLCTCIIDRIITQCEKKEVKDKLISLSQINRARDSDFCYKVFTHNHDFDWNFDREGKGGGSVWEDLPNCMRSVCYRSLYVVMSGREEKKKEKTRKMNSEKCENQITTGVILELNNLMYLFFTLLSPPAVSSLRIIIFVLARQCEI